MGFQAPIRRHEVKLDGEYDGFEATLRGKNLGEFLNMIGIGEVDLSDIGDQLKDMAGALISWNLVDQDGQPVPATPEAVFAQDQDMMLRLVAAWIAAVKGIIPAPLESSSTDGVKSLEESMPMAPLSESLAS